MDLAKIRQKAKSGQGVSRALELSTPLPALADMPPKTDPVEKLTELASPLSPDLQPVAVASHELFQPVETVTMPAAVRRNVPFDPVKAILAGREASGCDEESAQSSASEIVPGVGADYEELLCVRVCDEIYGINIMRIKEIIKPREVTEIPRTPSFVSGVISLRGVIIPIIDVRDRLGLCRSAETGKERVIVIRTNEEFSGLLVDEVIQVARIPRGGFEAAPAVLDGINRDFVSAIGRSDNRMIIVLNLESIADINLY